MPGKVKVPAKKPVKRSAARKSVFMEETGRRGLLDPKAARAAARGRQTRLIEEGVSLEGADLKRGENLKNGITGLANKAQVSDEQMAKLERMEPEKLDALYQHNKFVFDVYFNYSEVSTDQSGALMYGPGKSSDVDFLIEQYERLYGAL
jgi:hypothetical protein